MPSCLGLVDSRCGRTGSQDYSSHLENMTKEHEFPPGRCLQRFGTNEPFLRIKSLCWTSHPPLRASFCQTCWNFPCRKPELLDSARCFRALRKGHIVYSWILLMLADEQTNGSCISQVSNLGRVPGMNSTYSWFMFYISLELTLLALLLALLCVFLRNGGQHL